MGCFGRLTRTKSVHCEQRNCLLRSNHKGKNSLLHVATPSEGLHKSHSAFILSEEAFVSSAEHLIGRCNEIEHQSEHSVSSYQIHASTHTIVSIVHMVPPPYSADIFLSSVPQFMASLQILSQCDLRRREPSERR